MSKTRRVTSFSIAALARHHPYLGRRPVGGGTADRAGIGNDGGLKELGPGCRRDANPQIANAGSAAAVWVDPIGQDDQIAARGRIDPDCCPGEPEMADGPLRKER